MINPAEIIHLSKQAFWNVDMDKLDYNVQANAIIRRVFDHVSWDDIIEAIAYYGRNKVISALTSAPYLKEIAIVFASKLFHIPYSDFKCSTTNSFTQSHNDSEKINVFFRACRFQTCWWNSSCIASRP